MPTITADRVVDLAMRPVYRGIEWPRVYFEAATMPLSLPWLAKFRAKGSDGGRPVLVVPPIGIASWALEMRLALKFLGHTVHCMPELTMITKSSRQVRLAVIAETVRLSELYGEPVTLLGWCYGGAFTRMAAHAVPQHVRQVINMGTALDAWYYPTEFKHHGRDALPVPSTSLYSRSDTMFDHHRLREPEGRRLTENIKIHASHFGMGNNPFALYVIADRLAQPAGEWRPFAGFGGFNGTKADDANLAPAERMPAAA